MLTHWWSVPTTLLCVSMTTACASFEQPSPKDVPIPPSLLERCPDLRPPQDGSARVLLRTMIEWAQQHQDCQARHEQLVNAVGKAPGN